MRSDFPEGFELRNGDVATWTTVVTTTLEGEILDVEIKDLVVQPSLPLDS